MLIIIYEKLFLPGLALDKILSASVEVKSS